MEFLIIGIVLFIVGNIIIFIANQYNKKHKRDK